MSEKFNIKGFIRASMLDWPGKIASVIFLGGCGFRCPACHNHSLVLAPASIPDYPLETILHFLESREAWIDGVVITGGEPTGSPRLSDLMRILKEKGMRIKLETNGSNPLMLEALLDEGLMDGASMDVKAPLTRAEYSAVAGLPVNPAVIRRSIDILRDADIEVFFRTTVIPGLVEEPQLERIREVLGDVSSYRIQAFRNNDTLDPAFGQIEPFDSGRVERMRLEFEVPSPEEWTPGAFVQAL